MNEKSITPVDCRRGLPTIGLPIFVIPRKLGQHGKVGGTHMSRDQVGFMGCMTLSIVVICTLAISGRPLTAQDMQTYSPEQVRAGSAIYSRYCSICHGPRMQEPDAEIAAFDLRHFPRDQHDRFVNSVTSGKNTMPPWGELLKSADIEALWAYICAGEK